MTLNKKHVQDFFKRLRDKYYQHEKKWKIEHPPIKYYACGEYGGRFRRPHYHIILFNAADVPIRQAWMDVCDYNTKDHYTIGTVDIRDLTPARIRYALKYMTKESKIGKFDRDDRIKEFSLMSKGLGSNYLTDAMINWHKADFNERMNIVIEDGHKIAIPRYYKNKIYTEEERKKLAWHFIEKNIIDDEKRVQDLIAKFGKTDYLRIQIENHLNSFKKMYKNAEQGRTIG